MQNHLNLIYREEEREMIPLCRDQQIAITPYSPLASGRLTRDWTAEATKRSESDKIAMSKYDATVDADRTVIERLAEIAEKKRCSTYSYRSGMAAAKTTGGRTNHRSH